MTNLEKFRNLMVLAAVDGKVTEEELMFLSNRAARWGLSNEQVQTALTFARSPEAALEVPVLRSQKREILADLLRMMAVDGEIAEQERSLFALAAASMEYGQEELNRLIDEVLHRD